MEKFLSWSVSIILLMVLGAIVKGYTIFLLWKWFVTPVFGTSLTLVYAMGLSLLVGVLTAKFDTNNKNNNNKLKNLSDLWATFIGYLLGKCGTALFVGWIYTLFI